MTIITQQQMESMFPGSGRFAGPISDTINKWKITNPAMFISQIGEETGGLRVFNENLHYSAQRLLQVFPYYFNDSNVAEYDNNPEAIANKVYGGRMGNGPESSGEGYLYRGRGAIQLTGKSNYQAFANAMGMSLGDVIAYISTDEGVMMSAGWYWNYANVNPISQDIVATTKRINGGLINLATRETLYNKAITIFPTNVSTFISPAANTPIIVVAPVANTTSPSFMDMVANFGYSLVSSVEKIF